MGAGISNVPPLTEEELGKNFDELAANNNSMTEFLTRDEFIHNALIRETELLQEEIGVSQEPDDKIDFTEYY